MGKNKISEIRKIIENTHVNLGEQVHINHEDCDAGLDTKRRLYIRRTERGEYLLYCHNCGKSGYHREAFSRVKLRKKATTPHNAGSTCNVTLPYDSTGDQREWPIEARHWLRRTSLSNDEVATYGMVWSDDRSRLIQPVRSCEGVLLGYQERKIFSWDTKPKYLTKRKDKNSFFFRISNHKDSISLVITEDILSAIKVGRQFNTLALLGSNLTTGMVEYIVQRGYDNFYIWLDNDNPTIRKTQQQIARRLEMIASGIVKVIKTDKDPKYYTNEEINRYVKA